MRLFVAPAKPAATCTAPVFSTPCAAGGPTSTFTVSAATAWNGPAAASTTRWTDLAGVGLMHLLSTVQRACPAS